MADAKAEKKKVETDDMWIGDKETCDFVICYHYSNLHVNKSVLKMGCDVFKTKDLFDIDKEDSWELSGDFGITLNVYRFLVVLHRPFSTEYVSEFKGTVSTEDALYAMKLVIFFGHTDLLNALSAAFMDWSVEIYTPLASMCRIAELASLMAPASTKTKPTHLYVHLVYLLHWWINAQGRTTHDNAAASTVSREEMAKLTGHSPRLMFDLLMYQTITRPALPANRMCETRREVFEKLFPPTTTTTTTTTKEDD